VAGGVPGAAGDVIGVVAPGAGVVPGVGGSVAPGVVVPGVVGVVGVAGTSGPFPGTAGVVSVPAVVSSFLADFSNRSYREASP